jgi:acetyl esterase/lipase
MVAVPEMPWSQRREYDVPYAAALEIVAAAGKDLQDRGAARLIVGGHSLGANAALAYAASGRPVAGVFALSPGHVPEAPGFRREVASGVQKAREMIADGKGAEQAWFPDSNQGRTRQVRTSAEAYLSYFDPEGMGSLMASCRRIPPSVPLFMAVGESEGILPYARDRLFTAAPRHEHSVFLAVPGDHFSAPRAAAPRLLEWLHLVTG